MRTYDQFLAQRSEEVRARITRLNPVRNPAVMLRGWFPHRRSHNWYDGNLSVKDFVHQYGGAVYRQLPKEAFVRHGKRKSIRLEFIQDNRHLEFVSN